MTEIQNKLTQLGLAHTTLLSDIIGPISSANNLNSYLVGGIVRDALLNRPSKDFDICVSGDPVEMAKLGDWIYSQLSDKMKNKYSMALKDPETGLRNTNLREFLQNCGGGVLTAFMLYLSGQTDIAPVIYPRFLVAMTKMNGEDVEFVATRSEDYTTLEEGRASRKRNPGQIAVATEYEDAIRRDFTMNALYVNLATGELLDPTGNGINDIKNRIIRATRDDDPELVFLEDPLRILRAIRQSAQLGFNIDPRTADIIGKLIKEKGFDFFGPSAEPDEFGTYSSWGSQVSAERIRDELIKILLTKNADQGLNGLLNFGILDIILPEVSELAYDKEARHKNLWQHTLAVLNNVRLTPEIETAIEDTAPKVNMDPSALRKETLLRLKLGALLHDVGKIESRSYGEIVCPSCQQTTRIRNLYDPACELCGAEINTETAGSPTFRQHQYISEKLAKNILKRFKFHNRMIKWVARDCALHQVQFDDYLGEEISDIQPGMQPSKKMLAEKLYANLADRPSGVDDAWDELNFAVRIYGLIQADSSANPVAQQARVRQFISEYETARQKRQEEQEWQNFNKPVLTGDEIMEMFGVRPGKWIGDIHNRLREDKLNNPEGHTKERAIQLAQEELAKWGPEIYKQ